MGPRYEAQVQLPGYNLHAVASVADFALETRQSD